MVEKRAEARARELAERIASRRADCGDPALALLPDHPLGVALHVGRHRRRIPPDKLRDDIADAWLILQLVPDLVNNARRLLIEAGTEPPPTGAGMTYVQIAPLLGQTSRAGVEALRRRLEAACKGLPKDAAAARAYGRDERRDGDRITDAAAGAAGVVVRTLARYRDQLPGELLGDLDDLVAELNAVPAGGQMDQVRLFAVDATVLVRNLHTWSLPKEVRAVVDAGARRLGIELKAPAGVRLGQEQDPSQRRT